MKKTLRVVAVLTALLLVAAFIVAGVWYFSQDELEVDSVPPAYAPSPHIDLNASGQTAWQLAEWAENLSGQLKISPRALMAYGNAEQTMQQTRPQCHLRWTTLAGLAYVESAHGTYGGAEVLPNGDISEKIRGPLLDGTNNTERIRDTDNGLLDGNAEFDVAMGPFQFIPETWKYFGVDANGDGVANPDNIDDAAVAAARYLCHAGRNLLVVKDWRDAILSYNRSQKYVRQVHYAASRYGVGEYPKWTDLRFFELNF